MASKVTPRSRVQSTARLEARSVWDDKAMNDWLGGTDGDGARGDTAGTVLVMVRTTAYPMRAVLAFTAAFDRAIPAEAQPHR